MLVTGSAGFIGRHTVETFRAAGDFVVEMDRNGARSWDLAAEADAAIEYIVSLQPDVIIHLASSVSSPGSIARPFQTFTDTVGTTATIMEAARRWATPVILTSSVKARDGRTPYGAAKVMAETWATEMSMAYGIPLIIDRPGTVYGPGQEGSPESGWVSWFLKARDEGKKVTINGDGTQIRDLLYVQDYADLLLIQAHHFEDYPGTWDIGGGKANAVSVLEMARYLGLRYEFGPERYGDAPVYVGVNDVPGWEPTTHWADTGMFR